MQPLRLLLVLLTLPAIAHGDQAQQEASSRDDGFIGLVDGNELHIRPPKGGRVVVDGVECSAAARELQVQQARHAAELASVRTTLCAQAVVAPLSAMPDELQQPASRWAAGVKHFFSGDTLILVVANRGQDGQYEQSIVYQWDRIARSFSEVQQIQTRIASCVQAFVIGGIQFLAFGFSSTGYRGGKIFTWNKTLSKFDFLQEFPVEAYIHDITHFEVEDQHYLFTSHRYGHHSALMQWDRQNQTFVVVETLLENVGFIESSVYFEIGGMRFLAVSSNKESKFPVFTFVSDPERTNSSKHLVLHHEVSGVGSYGLAYSRVGGHDFLVVGRRDIDGDFGQLNTDIYRWSQDSQRFEHFQAITLGSKVIPFQLGGSTQYLAVVGGKPSIFAWDGIVGQFVEMVRLAELDSAQLNDFDHFEIDNTHYLASAVRHANDNPSLFAWNPLCAV